MKYIALIIGLLFLAGCLEEQLVINYSEDQCYACKMTISQANYGAALKTAEGRVYKFDALECMMEVVRKNDFPNAAYYAVAFDAPKELKAVERLHFVVDEQYRSPMGANLAAFENARSCMAPDHVRRNAMGTQVANNKPIQKKEFSEERSTEPASFDGNWSQLKIHFGVK